MPALPRFKRYSPMRRAMVATLAGTGLTAGLGVLVRSGRARAAAEIPAGGSCVVTPSFMEGPFFVDERLNRSDLTSGAAHAGVAQGLPLRLNVEVSAAGGTCAPLAGIQVDVWHADALGAYSDVGAQRGQPFLRGYQVTDPSGRVSFRTVYPGWYPGRAVHIHVKARAYDAGGNRTLEFTTQIFFDEATNDAVLASAPYNRRGRRDTTNAQERVTRDLVAATSNDADTRGLVASFPLSLRV